jgi:NADH-quinone oxidoreductase subunit M
MLFWPLAGALLILVIPREDIKTIRRVGLIFAFMALGLAIYILVSVVQQGTGKMLYESIGENPIPWIASFDIYYILGIDGLSAPMIVLSTLMVLLALFYSTRTVEMRVKEYFSLFLLLETSLLGIFMAVDMVLFYAFWLLSLLPILLLISIWGGEQRERAATKFFLYNLLGSVAMLLAILAVYTRVSTFNILEAAQEGPYSEIEFFVPACVTFLAFFIAFAIRLPSFPLHTWLPEAQTEASTAVNATIAGAFLSTGGYGLIRIVLPLFPKPFHFFAAEVWVLPALAVTSIVYGALVCMAQWDLKRLISYSSVVQMGFVTLGVCAAAAGYNHLGDPAAQAAALDVTASGLNGAAMQMFAHGIIMGALFFLTGILYRRTHTYDLKAFGGLAKQIPHYYGLMLLMGLAATGLPGLVGFWGELFTFKGVMGLKPGFAFVGILGVIFATVYTLWKIVQHIFLGTLDEERWGQLKDMAGWERLTVWPLAVLTIVLGFYPTPLLDLFNTALTTLLEGLP